MRRFSRTVRPANTRRPSGTWLMPSRTISWPGFFVMSFPSKVTVPPLEGSRPVIVCRVVVLPAPFAPISATTSPSFTSKETSRSAWIRP